MTREGAIRGLKEAQENGDYEGAHMVTDDILCEFLESLGYEDIVAEWVLVGKWYA